MRWLARLKINSHPTFKKETTLLCFKYTATIDGTYYIVACRRCSQHNTIFFKKSVIILRGLAGRDDIRSHYYSRYVSGRFSVAPFSSNSRKATPERDQKVTLVPLAASNHERESSRRGSHRPTREGYLGSSQP